jgi:hypothetical protein
LKPIQNQLDGQKPLIFRSAGRITKKGTTRSTIAGIVEGTNIKIGIAVCSTNDQFIKAKGRLIAVGRAVKHPETIIPIVNNEPLKSFLDFSKEYIEHFKL